MKRVSRFLITCFLLCCLGTAGCDPTQEARDVPATATLGPTRLATQPVAPTWTAPPTATAVVPSPTAIVPDTGWEPLRSGLERRIANLFNEDREHVEQLYMLRLERERFRFGVANHPKLRSLEAWQTETDALLVVNGGFFRQEGDRYLPNGLTIVDGEAMGTSYGAFGGMLAVTPHGPELRWLAQTPYDPNEALLAAVQSFPMLVKPGGEIGFPEQYEDHRQARRTVIGQDRSGRILFIVASRGYFTLHQLSVYLAQSDLELELAINLDGGPSSGLLLASPAEKVPAYIPLPVVITVHAR